ncbi:flagellar biosynthesis regulator FlaF [Marinivivus vitaminiproducens]|uniref:flagellar biosynthesis regulator FlaF n=1 Tax=Marinivivus vitaminiproducens TaxID=3035935 RepID=UPI0027A427FE|nr:flagellar biosynthesis regulator FlaF [Geminicoccaceae bacterium SCSIO 64248]
MFADQATRGYRSTIQGTASPKDLEARLFAEITAGLIAADRDDRRSYGERAAALHRNLAFWDALRADLASGANRLPLPLKDGLIGLARFVQTRSARLLQEEGPLEPLIAINRAMMAGLAGRPGERHGRP